MVRFVGGRRADEWGLTPQRGLSRGRMVLMRAQRRAARRRVLPCGRVGRVAVRAVSGPCGGGNRVGQRWRLGGERAGRVGTQPRADPWGGALRGALRGRGGAAGVAREGCRAVGPEKREREVGHGWRERGVGAAEARGGHVPALGRRRGWGEAGGAVVGRQGPRQARPGKRRAGGRRGGGGTPREQRRPGRDRARGGTRRAGAYARWARMGCSGCTGGGCGGGGGRRRRVCGLQGRHGCYSGARGVRVGRAFLCSSLSPRLASGLPLPPRPAPAPPWHAPRCPAIPQPPPGAGGELRRMRPARGGRRPSWLLALRRSARAPACPLARTGPIPAGRVQGRVRGRVHGRDRGRVRGRGTGWVGHGACFGHAPLPTRGTVRTHARHGAGQSCPPRVRLARGRHGAGRDAGIGQRSSVRCSRRGAGPCGCVGPSRHTGHGPW
mmetsp:Transcript_12414/g.39985  ORF Transcript_12414/g.39985 Transcript_12414/m.39985 type:complete len:438 (+) Transcript_12414:424-1737(+)